MFFEQMGIKDMFVRCSRVGKAMLSFHYTTSEYFAKVLEDSSVQHGVLRKQLM